MSAIRTERVPRCMLCGEGGRTLHEGLRDHLFGAPGSWRLARCPGCGLVWLDPRPVPEDIGLVYETYYTHAGALAGGEEFSRHFGGALSSRVRRALVERWQQARADVLARELGYGAASGGGGAIGRLLAAVPVLRDRVTLDYAELPVAARGTLLDVGCGNGTFLVRMRELGWRVVGVEPDPSAARLAREAHGLEVHAGTLDEAAIPPSSFDALVLSHVVEHVHDVPALLRGCARVLRPGGIAVIMTPNVGSFGHARLGRAWRGLEPPRHLHLFDPETLAACVRWTGMEVQRVRTSARLTGSMWYAGWSTARAERTGVAVNTRWEYVGSYAMQALEDALRIVRPSAGDEIVLMATVPKAPEGVA